MVASGGCLLSFVHHTKPEHNQQLTTPLKQQNKTSHQKAGKNNGLWVPPLVRGQNRSLRPPTPCAPICAPKKTYFFVFVLFFVFCFSIFCGFFWFFVFICFRGLTGTHDHNREDGEPNQRPTTTGGGEGEPPTIWIYSSPWPPPVVVGLWLSSPSSLLWSWVPVSPLKQKKPKKNHKTPKPHK